MPSGPDDLLDLAALDGRIDDADFARAAPPLGARNRGRAAAASRGSTSLQLFAGDLLVEVLRRDEVRLDDDAIAGRDDVAERVPLRAARAAASRPRSRNSASTAS